MTEWDGRTERRNNPSDHDNITRLIVIMENHIGEDKSSFKEIRDQIGRHAIFIYMGLGVLATLKFIFKG